jgi:predicted nuclease of restriction endonuclease-like RecB superfamily|tara:strand:+ start:1589 stop:2014 length:426 start_codon:yes stop_codon:yes gene_type:complete
MKFSKKQQHRLTVSNGIKHGYRSGLEDKLSKQIKTAGIEVQYETDKISYQVPPRQAKYTPDFRLPKDGGFFYVEAKGIWDVKDRQKHLLIQEQYPEIDIRFVFSNSNNKLYKGSKSTYASFCDKHRLQWAHKTIPDEWLHE